MDSDGPKHLKKELKIGMRIVKTVVAIYLSVTVTDLIGGRPLNAAIASFISLKTSHRQTKQVGKNRILGTLIGGLFSILFLYMMEFLDVELFTNTYYIMMSILLIPIIKTTSLIKKSGMTSNAVIVVLITLLSYIADYNKYTFVVNRMVDTLVGCIISIVVNKALPPYNLDNKKNTDLKRNIEISDAIQGENVIDSVDGEEEDLDDWDMFYHFEEEISFHKKDEEDKK